MRGALFLLLTCGVFLGGWIYGMKTKPQAMLAELRNPFVQPLLTKIELRDKITKLNNDNIYSFKQNEVKLEGFDETSFWIMRLIQAYNRSQKICLLSTSLT